MTITIDIPDDLAARAQAAGIGLADASRIMTAGFAAAVEARTPSTGIVESIASLPRRASLMDFMGVGHGSPGAISSDGTDVDAYIRQMRDEWDADEDDVLPEGEVDQ